MIDVESDATPAERDYGRDWREIDWERAEREVRRLQARIVKATERGKWRRVKSLQRLLTSSRNAKALALRRVTESKGKETAGVDGELWLTDHAKGRALERLQRRGYRALPLRRVYIPKRGGGRRMLGIPCMRDRAMQALFLLSLEPIAETTGDGFSYGFRPLRSCWDAREQLHILLAKRVSPQWILDADIEKCFDRISHGWLLQNIPLPERMLKQWLRCGAMEEGQLTPTSAGTPQGGVISPTLANMTLDGLTRELETSFVKYYGGRRHTNRFMLNAVRYADDFVITGATSRFLEDEVIPSVSRFLGERGLRLSPSKTRIRHIREGFNFLGYTARKFKDKLIIRPSKESVQSFKRKVRKMMRETRGQRASLLVQRLNSLINGWGRYFQTAVSKEVFSSLDYWLYGKLIRWSFRRHPKWGKRTCFNHYFCRDQEGRKRFCVDGTPVMLLSKIPIRRHPKTPALLNPFSDRHRADVEALRAKRRALRFPSSLLTGSC